MPENLHLVTELAIIMIAAGVFTVISKVLKQPVILGYIMAGFLIGPKLGLFPQFGAGAIAEWSEIGIIFLLFGLGLEFSFKKLLKIGSSALIMAVVNFVGMFITGTITAALLGWSGMEGIFLGGMMSMSSTTIIIKSYDDLGYKKKPYASLIFGALVFEDLIAVLLMVLLSTLAVTGKFEGMQMLEGILKLVFFLILWFLVGIFVIPLILKKAKNYLTDEIMLLVSLGLCFLMVVLANMAGFSSALGAFVMGSILAETVEGHRIEALTKHIKEMFGAVFFVSVGMMVDPAVIAEHWGLILILTLVTITGILFYSTAGALMAGKGLDTAVHAGFTLAQLGEFSFIIAGLGCSLGVMRGFIYPVIIAVSVITTFTTPYMIKLGDPVSKLLHERLPEKILSRINPPENSSKRSSKEEENTWKELIKAYLQRVVLYGVICIAIVIGCKYHMSTVLKAIMPGVGEAVIKGLDVLLSVTVLLPFLYGMLRTGKYPKKLCEDLLANNEMNKWPILTMVLIKVVLATYFVIITITYHYRLSWWGILLVAAGIMTVFILSRNSIHQFTRLEKTFLQNYHEKENMPQSSKVTMKMNKALDGYDVKMEAIVIREQSSLAGLALKDTDIRKRGCMVVSVMHEGDMISNPGADYVIRPGDEVWLVGSETALAFYKNQD